MDTPAKDLPLAEKIRECQIKTKQTYGYRRVWIWLERQGIHHNPKTILRVMQKYKFLVEEAFVFEDNGGVLGISDTLLKDFRKVL